MTPLGVGLMDHLSYEELFHRPGLADDGQAAPELLELWQHCRRLRDEVRQRNAAISAAQQQQDPQDDDSTSSSASASAQNVRKRKASAISAAQQQQDPQHQDDSTSSSASASSQQQQQELPPARAAVAPAPATSEDESASVGSSHEPMSFKETTRKFRDYEPFKVKNFLDSMLGDDEEGFKFVFIDPGERDVITFMEGFQCASMSNNEYHGLRGTKKARERMERLKERHWQLKERQKEGTLAKLNHFEKDVSSKTPYLERFLAYLKALFPILDGILEFHQTKSVKEMRFRSFTKKQKALEAVCDRIYNHGELRKTRNDLIVPVFGDANFMGRGRKRRRLLVPITSLKRLLRRKQRGRSGRLCFLDEFRSSKLCHGCFEPLQPFVTKKDEKIHACRVCACKSCNRKYFNRDWNAVLNFVVLFLHRVVLGIEVPVPFRRQVSSKVDAAVEGL